MSDALRDKRRERALVDRRIARDTLQAAREIGVPWRVFAAEVANIKQVIAEDIERELAKLHPLRIPHDVPRIEQTLVAVLARAEKQGYAFTIPASAITSVIVV